MWLSVVRFHFCNDVFSWWNSIFFLLCISFLYLNVKKQSKKHFLVGPMYFLCINLYFLCILNWRLCVSRFSFCFFSEKKEYEWKEDTHHFLFSSRSDYIKTFDIHRTQSIRYGNGKILWWSIIKCMEINTHSDKGSPLRESLRVTWARRMQVIVDWHNTIGHNWLIHMNFSCC